MPQVLPVLELEVLEARVRKGVEAALRLLGSLGAFGSMESRALDSLAHLPDDLGVVAHVRVVRLAQRGERLAGV